MNRAIFLDRDNTIVTGAADSSDPQQISLIRGAAHAIASLRLLGFRIVVIANEGAVARGVCTEAEVDAVHQHIAQMAHEAAGAIIDRFYFCPYHPNGTVAAYRRDHPWRKPSPGMILQAACDLDVNLAESWMVGDSERDIEAGLAAGCRTILVGDHAQDHTSSKAHYKAGTLAEAAAVIAQYKTRAAEPATAHIVTKKVHLTTAAVASEPSPVQTRRENNTEKSVANSLSKSSIETDHKTPPESSPITQSNSAEPTPVIINNQEETIQLAEVEGTNEEKINKKLVVDDKDTPHTVDQTTNKKITTVNENSPQNTTEYQEGDRESAPAKPPEKSRIISEQRTDTTVRELRPLHMPIKAVQSDDESASQSEARTNRLLMDVLSEIRSWRTSAREFTPLRLFAFVAMALILLGALASAIYIEGDRGLAWIGVALVAQLTVIGLLILLPNG